PLKNIALLRYESELLRDFIRRGLRWGSHCAELGEKGGEGGGQVKHEVGLLRLVARDGRDRGRAEVVVGRGTDYADALLERLGDLAELIQIPVDRYSR